MANREVENWVTINGRKVPIYKDNVKVETNYASDLSDDEKKKAEGAAKNIEKTVEDLTASHNMSSPDDDLEDYIWEKLYDVFPLTLPDDMSVIVFDNSKGSYDREKGKIGFAKVSLHSPDNKTVEMELSLSYNWQDDFDDEYLEEMGIYKD